MRETAADHPPEDAGALAMFESLLRRTHLSTPAELAGIVAAEARYVGAQAVVLYLADLEQTTLVPLPAPDAEGREPLAMNGTLAGRAYATTSMVTVDDDEGSGRRVWMPLLDGTERVGTIELEFAEPPTDDVLALAERYAHLVATLIVAKGAYSDHFERVRRLRPMSIASELAWSLTPPRVLTSDRFGLAALLEPAYDMGGDAYDYALNDDVLHLGVFDAMGHGLAAAGMAAFALTTYRNSRRNGLALAETYDAIDTAIAGEYPGRGFVTALLAELDVVSGRLRWVSAGHPPPLLLRGGRLVGTLALPPVPPAGMQLATGPPEVGHESLEPGDMVLLYTDGLTEARRPDRELFTVERLGEFIEREAASGHTAPETLRRLRDAIIGRGEGTLHDDATALLVEWRRETQDLLPQMT